MEKFSFHCIQNRQIGSLQDKDQIEFLLKWSMKYRIKVQFFSFDQMFHIYQKDEFVLAFMQDEEVRHRLQILSSSGQWVSLGLKAESVTVQQIPCSILSMSFFDRLQKHNIVKDDGNITKCFDEFSDGFTISDELRKMLLLDDSENYDIFSDAEREEFLFRLFKHLCLGGEVCQYEDNVQPYLDLTKLLYKDLVSVQKDGSSGDLMISSFVLKVTASEKGCSFYPSSREHCQDFAYLIVDPLKRHVKSLYHNFGACRFE